MEQEENDDAEIEITEAMIAAGIYAARAHFIGGSLRDLVINIFVAMQSEATG